MSTLKPTTAPQARPHKLPQAEADRCHARPWDEAACARFAARVSRFLRVGIDATDADDLAERQHLHDIDGDGLGMCGECSNLAGHASTGWRCRAAGAAGVATPLPAELVVRLQRCPAFAETNL